MKNIKPLIIKFLSFFILIILIDFSAGYFFRFLEKKAMDNNPQGLKTEYSMWKAEGDILIFGASEVHHSIIPSLMKQELGMSAYNCAYDGQPFYYQYCMINSIIDRKRPKVIIWSVFPNYLKNPTMDEKNSLSTLNPFYDSNKYCKRVINNKSKFENFKMLSKCYRYNSRIFDLLKNLLTKTNSDSGYLALSNTGYKYPTLDSRPIVSKENEAASEIVNSFIEVIDKCKKSNVELILIFAPRHQINTFNQSACYQLLKNISINSKVPFFEEYYCSPLFLNDSTLFKDNAHLNDKGARIFTNLVIRKVKEIIN